MTGSHPARRRTSRNMLSMTISLMTTTGIFVSLLTMMGVPIA